MTNMRAAITACRVSTVLRNARFGLPAHCRALREATRPFMVRDVRWWHACDAQWGTRNSSRFWGLGLRTFG
jgi:hypothetical protein